MIDEDEQYMRMTLTLAKRAYGRTSPNPMVGAVIVKDGIVIGRGYHRKAGTPHAEVNAFADAERRAPDKIKGATLYVNLEPCSTYGKTPPCTERIIASGISCVVFGTMDANPKHAGNAIEMLRSKGIEVRYDVLVKECCLLNESFFWWITNKRPFVILKMAMTLDGKIATESGDSKWVSSQLSRDYVQKLRCLADAVMVGGNTVRLDNPSLLVRKPKNWPCQPRRLVWTSKPLPPECQMLNDGGPMPETIKPETKDEWMQVLERLGSENVTTLLLEGGGELAASALRAGIVNKVNYFIAPKLLGGRNSRTAMAGDNPLKMDSAIRLNYLNTKRLGEDLLITASPVDWS